MQNLVTCVYETKLAGLCRRVTITWMKDVKGHGLCVTLDDPSCQYTCKIKMNPWSFWKKHGVKTLEVCNNKVDVFWDLSAARYICGPEPHTAFYVAVVCNGEMVLLLGDRDKEGYKKTKARPCTTEATLLSRTEHVFGTKHFCAKARFDDSGKAHDIDIECQVKAPTRDPYLFIRVDRQMVVQVKNLEWKFRGNQTVLVDGVPVEVFWDVHNWIFSAGGASNATFIFQASLNGGTSKVGKSKEVENMIKWSGELNGRISVMKLAGARSLRSACELVTSTGSSLMLHAWKSE